MTVRASVLYAIALSTVLAVPGGAAWAQIRTDGTVGLPARNLAGPDFAIGADLGRQVGGNLFHSFQSFNVPTGGSATFSGPNSVSNIIGRVTGGLASSVDGRIASTIPNANLFLLNPAGWLFGPNASLDVGGSFHVSSADYLKLADGTRYLAGTSGGSSFSAAPPEAFGFLGNAPPAAIATANSTLIAAPGKELALIGGPVLIAGGRLAAPAGQIYVASAAGPGDVPIDPTVSATPARFGPVAIVANALVEASDEVSGQGGGSIYIRGGVLTIDAGTVRSGNFGAAPGGPVVVLADDVTLTAGGSISTGAFDAGRAGDIRVTASRRISADGSGAPAAFTGVISSTFSPLQSGRTGDVTINAGTLSLAANARIGTSTFAVGGAGMVQVTGLGSGSMVAIDGSSGASVTGIFSNAEIGSTGPAGVVSVSADTIQLHGGGGAINGNTFAAGDAGRVYVAASGGLSVSDGAKIRSSSIETASDNSLPTATGRAGTVQVHAASITVTGQGAGIEANASLGSTAGGTVAVTADQALTLLAGGAIASDTFGAANAGDVTVQAPSIVIDGTNTTTTPTNLPGVVEGLTGIFSQAEINSGQGGRAGTVTVRAPDGLAVTGNGKISSSTFAGGDAGNVSVDAGDITVSSLGEIRSSTFGSGNGGAVSVHATTITIDGAGIVTGPNAGRTGINSRTETISSGNAGAVTVTAGRIALANGGTIGSEAAGKGAGGDVSVTAGQDLIVDGAGSQITAQSSGGMPAGAILVSTPSLTLRDGGAVTTQSSTSSGGNVAIVSRDRIYLVGGRILTSVASGPDSGGNVAMDPQFLVLNQGTIRANADHGRGGDITIAAGQLLRSSDSVIDASSRFGVSGNIAIRAPDSDVTGSLAELSGKLFDPSAIRREGCASAVRAERQPSSLVVRGRGGQAQDGEGAQSGTYFAGHDRRLPADAAPTAADPAGTNHRDYGSTVLRITCRSSGEG